LGVLSFVSQSLLIHFSRDHSRSTFTTATIHLISLHRNTVAIRSQYGRITDHHYVEAGDIEQQFVDIAGGGAGDQGPVVGLGYRSQRCQTAVAPVEIDVQWRLGGDRSRVWQVSWKNWPSIRFSL
jgi:hypothetical protein